MKKTFLIFTAVMSMCLMSYSKAENNGIPKTYSEVISWDKVDDASFLEFISNDGGEISVAGRMFMNINDGGHNLWLSHVDTSLNRVDIGFSDILDYDQGHGVGVLHDGNIQTVELNSMPFEVNVKVISMYHLTMEYNGRKDHLYAADYLEKEAIKVPLVKLDDLEVQIFTVDGHKFAKTNLYGMLPLDDNNTAFTIGFFPDSDEGQEATIRFGADCVTVSYGNDNKLIYGNRHNGLDFAKNQLSDDGTVIGHTYANSDIGIQWTFVNEGEALVRFDDDGKTKRFTWEYDDNGHILIHGEYKDVDAGVEIKDNGKKLKVLDYSNGAYFIMLRIN